MLHHTCALVERWLTVPVDTSQALSPCPSTIPVTQLVSWVHAVLDAFPIDSDVSDISHSKTIRACTFTGGSRIDPGFQSCNLRTALHQVLVTLKRHAANDAGMDDEESCMIGDNDMAKSNKHSAQCMSIVSAVSRAESMLEADESWGKYWYCGLRLVDNSKIAAYRVHAAACVDVSRPGTTDASYTHVMKDPYSYSL